MKKILVIIPTRGRGNKIFESIESFKSTVTLSEVDICIAIDDDDVQTYDIDAIESTGAIVEINPRKKMIGTLNLVADKYKDDYEIIGFIGDDHRFRTDAWDLRFYTDMHDKVAIAYGNDLLMKEELPTAAFVTSNIIKALGYMVPTFLVHFYADNFWRDLGRACNILKYYEDIIIEHMHFSAGKSEKDEMYQSTNNDQIFVPDRDNYNNYLNGDGFKGDIYKVDAIL